MSLKVTLGRVNLNLHFAASFHSRHFTALTFCNQLWIVNHHALAILENTEEFQTSILSEGSKHSNFFLRYSGGDRNMGAPVRSDELFTVRIS